MGVKFYAGILVLMFLFTGVAASYSVPQKIPVQGRLTNASTGVVLSGEYNFTFRIYNASTSGTLLWDENQTLTVDGNGLWNALLGNNTVMSLNFSEDTYLEVELNHDGTPLPRVQLGSTPYAEWTDTAANLSCTDCLGTDEIEDIYLLNTGDNATGDYMFNGSFKVENSTGSTVLHVNASNGYVGIGTTTPGSKLDVEGNIDISDYNITDVAFISGGGDAVKFADDLNLSTNTLMFSDPSYNSSISLGGTSAGTNKPALAINVQPADPVNENAAIRVFRSGDVKDYGEFLVVEPNIGTVRFRLRSYKAGQGTSYLGLENATNLYVDGYVGIGTTSPQRLFTVAGAIPIVGFKDTDDDDEGWAIWDAGDYFGLYEYTATDWDSGSNRFVIKEGGNVGIGTISPSETLTVDGNVSLNNTLYVLKNGNVGIGTTSPSEMLEITHPTNASVFLSEVTGVAGVKLKYLGDYNRLDFVDTTSGVDTTIATFLRTGNVGIGTISPSEMLTVDGNVSLNNTLYVLKNGYVGIGTASPVSVLTINTGTSGTNPSLADMASGSMAFGNAGSASAAPMIIGRSDNAAGLVLRSGSPDGNTAGDILFTVRENDGSDFSTTTSAAYIFYRYLTPLVTILRNGYVGIGTTVPNKKLVVVGDANITGNLYVSGQQMTVPDYVFEEGYGLMPLSELDAYIQSNRHLPGISPANETSQVDVVGQQQKLLEKIEELTLYSIQLKEENAELRRAVCVIDSDASVCAGARA